MPPRGERRPSRRDHSSLRWPSQPPLCSPDRKQVTRKREELSSPSAPTTVPHFRPSDSEFPHRRSPRSRVHEHDPRAGRAAWVQRLTALSRYRSHHELDLDLLAAGVRRPRRQDDRSRRQAATIGAARDRPTQTCLRCRRGISSATPRPLLRAASAPEPTRNALPRPSTRRRSRNPAHTGTPPSDVRDTPGTTRAGLHALQGKAAHLTYAFGQCRVGGE